MEVHHVHHSKCKFDPLDKRTFRIQALFAHTHTNIHTCMKYTLFTWTFFFYFPTAQSISWNIQYNPAFCEWQSKAHFFPQAPECKIVCLLSWSCFSTKLQWIHFSFQPPWLQSPFTENCQTTENFVLLKGVTEDFFFFSFLYYYVIDFSLTVLLLLLFMCSTI